jgi:hypothetical protein
MKLVISGTEMPTFVKINVRIKGERVEGDLITERRPQMTLRPARTRVELGRAVPAYQLSTLLRVQLAAVVHQETPRTGEFVGLPRQDSYGELLTG